MHDLLDVLSRDTPRQEPLCKEPLLGLQEAMENAEEMPQHYSGP